MSNLQINFEPNPPKFILAGKIDATTANSFEDALNSELANNTEGSITLDCSGLEYISSMGLRVLLKLRKKSSQSFKLENVPPAVMSILNVTGFSNLIEFSGGNNS